MHIKFLDHGKGDASFASAYVLDDYDHKGNLRAGVEVLRGDANTFNHACSANPHEWKYTSGVIAWSKDDNPNPEEIREVLDKFEKHAFAGLDKSQYHLFAVLHTDDDGSKHIHVLVPRMDLVSGKSLNIAPPLHHHHFDPLRDKLNLEKGWSRPDDILLAKFTQEPNHVAKINSQAEKLLPNFEKLKKNQLRHVIDNHIRSLLGTEIQDRSDIIRVLRQLDGVKEVTNGKHVTVVLNNDSRHRMKGAFYDENFELGAYRERLQRAAESGTNEAELRAAIKAADELLELSRTERATYNRERYPIERLTDQNHSHRIGPEQPEHPSPDRSNSELSSAIRRDSKDNLEYRFVENPRSFSFSPIAADRNRQGNKQHFDRSEASPSPSPSSSKTSDREPSGVHTDRNPVSIAVASSQAHDMGSYSIWSADAFNELIYNLSVQYELKNNQRPKRNDPTKLAVNTKPNQLPEHFTEINNEDRNRSVPSRTKLLADATNRIIAGASQFIKNHLGFLQDAGTRLEQQNQRFREREPNKKGFDFADEIGNFTARTRKFFSRISTEINNQFHLSISKVMDEGLRRSGLSEYAKKYSANGVERRKDTAHDRTLESVADACTTGLQRRNRNTNLIGKQLKYTNEECHELNREIDRLAAEISKIRIKPKPATDFETLRYDIYYRQYTSSHREFSAQQDYAYQNGRKFDVIHIIKQKSEKLKDYINQARNMLKRSDYELIEKIIKNDERMLKYLKCDAVLESQNSHFKDEISSYRACLENFESIQSTLHAVRTPKPVSSTQQSQLVADLSLDLDLKPKPPQDFDFDFDISKRDQPTGFF
ncbi:relaxase/mobilization nuclease domain-containing protein [Acinetobacter pittii]|uniref:relaxase/mobilization nuclease domain-containing protein n=1 Tax=Acinetobacter pittii TaxID=48296 RepID=UPI0020198D31|nr:relaxase/mobilization nuclease domain-containing protein [Acinetobacter pittii]